MSTGHGSGPEGRVSLRLYVAGESAGAQRALANRVRLIKASDGRIDIQVVDILRNPEDAEKAGIIATPTLSDDAVDPPRRLIGDISNIAEVLSYFGYPRKDAAP
ncbi:circadian clock KaiB family protein [Shinella sp. BYT-45]|uniref:circadian clock KaiB family protein n=1 Tax=Shinella sp. BYT-45 TaxID=3377377 RepID=UPI00397ECD9D